MRLSQFVARQAERYNTINIAAQNVQNAHFRDEFLSVAVKLSSPMPTPVVDNDYTEISDYFDRCRLHLIGA